MVSAVVLQHSLFDLTRVAIDSLRANDYRPDEIIVVDNGSPDLLEKAGAGWGWSSLVRLEQNTGYQRGTNAGWLAAQGEYTLLCNNDVALARTCIARLVQAIESDPALAWVCACYQWGGWPEATVRFPADVLEQLAASHGADRRRLDAWAETLTPDLHPCEVTEATVVLASRAARDSVGVFDDRLVFNHSHDYGMRLRAAGWKSAIERSAVFWHNPDHPTLAIVPTQGTPEQKKESDQIMADKWGREWLLLEK